MATVDTTKQKDRVIEITRAWDNSRKGSVIQKRTRTFDINPSNLTSKQATFISSIEKLLSQRVSSVRNDTF